MHLRARWGDKERKRLGQGLEKTASQKKRESKVSIRGAWSLWTVAARFKAPQKEPFSAMTDSTDKRWSMKADRCADSRREALAPASRVHYCGQTQLSGPNGPSALCHAITLTSHSESQRLSTPSFTSFSHQTLHSSLETFPGQSIAQLHFGEYISWQVLKLTYLSNSLTYWQCVKECRGKLSEGFLTGTAWKIRPGFILENRIEPQLWGLFYSSNTVRLRSFSISLKIGRQKYGQHGEWDPLCKTGDFHVLPLLNTRPHGAYSTSLQRKLPHLPRELRKKECRRFPQGNERQ